MAQHTPSTQKPDRHSQLPPHTTPTGFLGVQLVPTHALVESHCVAAQPPEQVVEHAPAPLQVKAPQPFSGSEPLVWLRQVPTKPVRLHATHEPLHELLQHTPSTHWPELHSQVLLHEAPFAFFAVQVEPAQYAVASHCEAAHAPEHVVLQLPAPLQP